MSIEAAIEDSLPSDALPVEDSQGTPPSEGAEVSPQASEVAELAKTLGIPESAFAGITDPAAAAQAARFLVEQTAQRGLNVSVAQAPAPQVPAPQAPFTPIDLNALGLAADEPAARAIQALEARVAQLSQHTEQFLQQAKAQQTAARESQRAQRAQEVNSVVASLADARYGNPLTGQQTATQQIAADRLAGLALGILQGERALGNPDPPLNVLFARAKFIDANSGVIPTTNAAPAAQALNTRASQPIPPQQASMTSKWSQDPGIRAALGIG